MDDEDNASRAAARLAQAQRLHQAGQLRAAESTYRAVLGSDPSNAAALHYLGVIAHQAGRHETAIELVNRSLMTEPRNPHFLSNLGLIYRAVGRRGEAEHCFRNAIEQNPLYAEAWANLGVLLRQLGRHAEAMDSYRRAIAVKPDAVEAWYNLGNLLQEGDRLDEAIACYERAVARRPIHAAALGNMGRALKEQGRIDEAIIAYRRAIAAEPVNAVPHSNLLMSLLVHPGYGPDEIFREHLNWATRHVDPLLTERAAHSNVPDPGRPLRIAYVSPDLNGHPIGRLIEPVLAQHDRGQFRITCYSDVGREDHVTDRLRTLVDDWHITRGQSDAELAARIRADRVDVLVDLALHGGGNRMLMLARKPAPVQVTFLGYPGTSGSRAIDYHITEPMIDPEHEQGRSYTERLHRIPGCYWCYGAPEDAPDVASTPADRHGYVTFGCLNSYSKVNDDALTLWSRILAGLPGSRLVLLLRGGLESNSHVPRQMERCGIDPGRVRFVPRVPRDEYWRLYQEIDVSLDPFPYNGHTTSLDSLWMGVPVVTLAGRTPVGRGGASILSSVGLPELIAPDADAYVKIAIALASRVDRLGVLRRTLRERLAASPTMDARWFTGRLERAYRSMWAAWCDERTTPRHQSR